MCLFLGAACAAEPPALKVGDPAPALKVGKWIQGDPVANFENGKAYIVEFWATWCGPCKVTIPDLNRLHLKFKDKGLTIVGVSISEEDQNDVPKFVKQMGTNMTYRVAVDDISKSERGFMSEKWMTAAGLRGIPSAFLINKEGKIAWIGSPFALKEKLIEDVLAGSFDVAKAAAAYLQGREMKEKADGLWDQFQAAAGAKDWTKAEELLAEVAKVTPEDDMDSLDRTRLQLKLKKEDFAGAEAVAKEMAARQQTDAPYHDGLAWMIATSGAASKGILEIAEKSAVLADKLTNGKDASVQETLARVQFLRGNKAAAIATQEKGLALADEKGKKAMQRALDSYKAGQLPE